MPAPRTQASYASHPSWGLVASGGWGGSSQEQEKDESGEYSASVSQVWELYEVALVKPCPSSLHWTFFRLP